jgi:hypothetical protein
MWRSSQLFLQRMSDLLVARSAFHCTFLAAIFLLISGQLCLSVLLFLFSLEFIAEVFVDLSHQHLLHHLLLQGFMQGKAAGFCCLSRQNSQSVHEQRRRIRQPARQCRFPLPRIQLLLCHLHHPMVISFFDKNCNTVNFYILVLGG